VEPSGLARSGLVERLSSLVGLLDLRSLLPVQSPQVQSSQPLLLIEPQVQLSHLSTECLALPAMLPVRPNWAAQARADR
jgi:hypothetical protein